MCIRDRGSRAGIGEIQSNCALSQQSRRTKSPGSIEDEHERIRRSGGSDIHRAEVPKGRRNLHNPVIAHVGDVKISIGVERQASRKVEALAKSSDQVACNRTGNAPVHRQNFVDRIGPWSGDENIAAAVHRHSAGSRKAD